MSNMSYCRFQNTLTDLRDCFDHIDEWFENALSEEEEGACKKLIKLCMDITRLDPQKIVDNYGEEVSDV